MTRARRVSPRFAINENLRFDASVTNITLQTRAAAHVAIAKNGLG
jgi:hypothetical protein